MSRSPTANRGAAQELAALRDLLIEALDRLETQAADNAGIDPDLRAGPLADAIWHRCGRHKALVTRTRLTQLAADEDGTRAVHANGHRRRRNGNGTAL